MNDKDKLMMDTLIEDKGEKYKVIVDNDSVCVEDVEKEEVIHTFEQFGYYLILELFQYLKINAEMC